MAKAALKAVEHSISVEESPGSMTTRWRLTAAGGDPRDSATENKPLRRSLRVKASKGETVR